VQAELDTLFGQLKGMAVRSREVSAQAFSKARKGFSAELFRLAGRHLLTLAQPRIDAARWNGLRVVAADASRLRVSTVSVQPPHLPLAAAIAYWCPRQMAWTPVHFNFF